MGEIKALLVLKYSSELIARPAKNGLYSVDYATIRRHGRSVASLLNQRRDLGLVVVTSAACKLLKNSAWLEICQLWRESLNCEVKGFQISDNDFDYKSACIINHAAGGGVSIVNGNDKLLSKGSRWLNNDYVSADIVGKAVAMEVFKDIELGIFTNVSGLLRDLNDSTSVLSVVHDIQAAKSLVADSNKPGTTGGMATKLDAVDMALRHGASKVWLAHGRASGALELARQGRVGTTFLVKTLPPVD